MPQGCGPATLVLWSRPRETPGCGWGATWEKGQKTMTAPRPRTRQPKQLDAGILQAEISSFRLHLAAGNKSAKTIRTYTEAVQWFAGAHLLRQDSRDTWEPAAWTGTCGHGPGTPRPGGTSCGPGSITGSR